MIDTPIVRLLVTIRLRSRTAFHFHHGGALMGLLCRALGTHHLPFEVFPSVPEAGRVEFDAGDSYCFGLTALERINFDSRAFIEGLRRVGESQESGHRARATLDGNFDVDSVVTIKPTDSAQVLARVDRLEPLVLHFVSPLRLELPDSLRRKGKSAFSPDLFPFDDFLSKVLWRLHRLSTGVDPDDSVLDRLREQAGPTQATVGRNSLYWLDVPVPGTASARPDRPQGITLGGVLGKIEVTGLTGPWRRLLVAACDLHIGKYTHYGFGRMRIEDALPVDEDPFQPSTTALDRAATHSALRAAADRIAASSDAAGVDGIAPGDVDVDDLPFVESLAGDLRCGQFEPQPLLGIIGRKRDGRARPLVIPAPRDRIAQRAVADVLGPAIDLLLEDCSFAYRKGFSRKGAAAAISRAYDDGFRYVLDADIESFFDSVDWELLSGKLEALFPYDPVRTFIQRCLEAPVVFEGRTIRRTRGLPQGSPLSPLLANLFLDEFDEELLGRDYRLVRFADDFVVLCRDPETAERARVDAAASLERLGLRLSEHKTSIASLDVGFRYLGYLFVRSLVLESPEAEADATLPTPYEVATDRLSWLADVPAHRVRQLLRRQAPGKGPPPVEIVQLGSPSVTMDVTRRPLYLLSPGTRLVLRGETVGVEEPERGISEIPIRSISHVVVIGRPRLTVDVLLALCESGVPVAFCRRTGQLRQIVPVSGPDWPRWMQQAACAADTSRCVSFASAVVAARLHNLAALIVRFEFVDAAARAASIRELERQCDNKDGVDSLRGLEGRGTAVFFDALGRSLPGDWGFPGRRRRPPPDAVNAMLSFGYTLLYNHVSTALCEAGLNPRIGLFHVSRGTHHALASDLQEEFRHLVEAHVWSLIRRREIGREDFAFSGTGACSLASDARRRFIERFEARLATVFSPEPGAQMTYREFMYRQALSIAAFVAGEVTIYRPLRSHA